MIFEEWKEKKTVGSREVLANKRASEIEKAATLAERERCAKVCDEMAKNYDMKLLADCAAEIRRGE